jgi:hypothetical protein
VPLRDSIFTIYSLKVLKPVSCNCQGALTILRYARKHENKYPKCFMEILKEKVAGKEYSYQ